MVAPASLDSATWLPFAGTISATLGSTDGEYTVYFGFRTILGTVLWTTNFITLDTVAPLITLENPPSSVVTNSLLHVYARVPEPIRGDSIRWSLSNTLGVVSGAGGWADQAYDPVTFHWTTNWFACYDLRMTNGTNRLTLQVTDDAGNTTVTNFVLTTDFSGLTTAPVTTMLWPLSGMTISGSNLVIHGQVDDPAALLSVEITTPASEVLTVPLTVLMKGDFTSDELVLDAGTSSVKVTARNANGLSSSTTFSVTVSTVVLNASSPTENMADPTVTVSGTVSTAGYNVWVNGVQVTVNGGNWTAANVANPGGANPAFHIRAIPSNANIGTNDATGNPTHAQAVNHVFLGELPPKIEMVSYENEETWHDTIGGPLYLLSEKDEFWMKGTGGGATNKVIDDDDIGNSWQRWFFSESAWPASGVGTIYQYAADFTDGELWDTYPIYYGSSSPPTVWQAANLYEGFPVNSFLDREQIHQRHAQTKIQLTTGGNVNPNFNDKWVLLRVTAERIFQTNPWSEPWTEPIPFHEIKIAGQEVNAGANLYDEGKIFLKLRAGMTMDITPQIDSRKYPNYVFHVEILPHPRIVMTRAFHPNFYLPGNKVPPLSDLHQAYQIGTEKLAVDHDTRYRDGHPVLTIKPTFSWRTVDVKFAKMYTIEKWDDVPAYVEFIIKNVPFTEVPGANGLFGPIFPYEYHDKRFFNAEEEYDTNALLANSSANINQVNRLQGKFPGARGLALPTDNRPQIALVPHLQVPATPIHEWLHMLGVPHRYDLPPDDPYPRLSPVEPEPFAIMTRGDYVDPASSHPDWSTNRDSINRGERTFIPGQ